MRRAIGLVCALMLLPAAVQATCYPIYADTMLDLGTGATMNGVPITTTDTGDTAVSTAGGTNTVYPTLAPLNPASFPSFCTGTCPSTTAYSIPAGSYNQVTATSKTTPYNFTGGGAYYIKTLTLANGATANFTAGDYFLETFKIENDAVINISSGPVRFFIGSSVEAGNKTSMNAGGVAANLQFLLYPGAKLQFGNQDQANNNIDFSGIIYAPYSDTTINLGNNIDYQGALVGAGAVSGGNNLSFTSDPTVSTVLEPTGQCVTEPAPVMGRFNAVDPGQDAIGGKLKTKVAGQAFTIDIIAVDSTYTGIETGFANTVKVELLNGADDSGVLDTSTGCRSSWSNIQTVASFTFASGDYGRKALNLTQAEAWPKVRVRVSYPATGTPTRIGCSADTFAIRPSYLAIVASDADWETAGTARTLNATTAGGTPYHKAGRPFTLTVTARNAANVITGNYAGTPTTPIVTCILPVTGCVLGMLSPGSFGGGGGTVVSTTANYSEVGAITLKLTDAAFAAIDNSDSSAAEREIPTTAAVNVGRFVPDHFDLGSGVMTPACAATGLTPFTYLGQGFNLAFTVTARNYLAATTQNYVGTLAKLSGTSPANFYFAPAGLATGDTAARLQAPASLTGTWSAGTATFSGSFVARRYDGSLAKADASLPIGPDGPFPNFKAAAKPVDSEGVTLPTAALDVDTDTTPGNDRQSIAGGLIRFGRLRLANAMGSELLALPMSLTGQYWDGNGFIANPDDSCTTLPAPALTFYSQTTQNQLVSGETTATLASPLVGGNASLSLSAPGSSNYGYLDVSIDLSVRPWLRYNWDGIDQAVDGNWLDDNPSARAAFGKRRVRDRVIIRRETY